MGSILSEAAANFENLSVEDLKAHLQKVAAAQVKQRERQKEYNATPEAKEKRTAYQTKRNAEIKADPEKYEALKEKRKAYMSKPEVVEKRKAYHAKRNAEIKALLAEAKKRGIDVKAVLAEPPATGEGASA